MMNDLLIDDWLDDRLDDRLYENFHKWATAEAESLCHSGRYDFEFIELRKQIKQTELAKFNATYEYGMIRFESQADKLEFMLTWS